jgi:hypothetical protein
MKKLFVVLFFFGFLFYASSTSSTWLVRKLSVDELDPVMYHERDSINPYEICYPLEHECPALNDGVLYEADSCGEGQESVLSEISSRSGMDFGYAVPMSSFTLHCVTDNGGTPTGYTFFDAYFTLAKSNDNSYYTEVDAYLNPPFSHTAPGEIAWTFTFEEQTARYFVVSVGENGNPLFVDTDIGPCQVQVSELDWD